MLKKAMICQPVNGLRNSEVYAMRERALNFLESRGYVVTFSDEVNPAHPVRSGRMPPLWYLGRAVELMSGCDALYLFRGWKDRLWCRLGHDIAEAYGLDIIYEEEENERKF